MKAYTVPLSLVGAALALGGGLAQLISPQGAVLPLVNLGLGVALVIVAGVLNPELVRQYGRWLNAFWGGIMVLGIIVMVNFPLPALPPTLRRHRRQAAQFVRSERHCFEPTAKAGDGHRLYGGRRQR